MTPDQGSAKEGPPTAIEIQDFINNIGLREVQDRWGRCVCCRKKGQWVPWWHETWKKQHESNCIFYLSKAFSRRFSFEALELDQKRRVALEDVARTGADARNYMASEPQGTPKGKFFKALNNLARITKAQAKSEALTPTQEKA